MRKRRWFIAILIAAISPFSLAQQPQKFSPIVRRYISVDAPAVALTHVGILDGTGTAATIDQTIVIENGKIKSIQSASTASIPDGAKVIDLHGDTVIPGLVGMHDHLVYPSGPAEGMAIYNEMAFSAPRLYLACGVTTIRTTGSLEPYTDLELKKWIDAGRLLGPAIFITGPYLEGEGAYTPQMFELRGAEDARRMVDYWAEEGATSFKAYMHITRAELAAAIQAAHRRGIKVTGHLCSIGFREAAALGIDDLEHGLLVDTEFDPGKTPDACPLQTLTEATLAGMDVEGEQIQATIRDLVAHHVAVTSTLPVFETFVANRPPLSPRVLQAMLPQARIDYLTTRARIAANANSPWPVDFKKEMQFERDFVKAGGLLLAGNDPTGYGGDLAGFGDLRGVELLVEAGFSPAEAIQIATANGAKFLGESARIGALAPGMQADMVVIQGDPSTKISDIENVKMVFKGGVGFDSEKMIESVRGTVGLH